MLWGQKTKEVACKRVLISYHKHENLVQREFSWKSYSKQFLSISHPKNEGEPSFSLFLCRWASRERGGKGPSRRRRLAPLPISLSAILFWPLGMEVVAVVNLGGKFGKGGGGGGGLVSVQKEAFFSVTCGGGPAKRERISESAFFWETEVPLLYRGIETGIYPGKGSGWICKGEKGKTR